MVSNIVQAIVDGFNGILSGFGAGVADFFQKLFLVNTGTAASPVYGNQLTTFATVSIVFVGIGLAITIARKVISMVKG